MADFASSRGQKDVLDIRDFTEWLISHGHADLKSLIENNHATTISIKASLAEGKEELLAKLSRLEGLLASLTAGDGSLADLAAALRPDSVLSAQAGDLLVSFETTQASKALESHMMDGVFLHFIDAKIGGAFTPTEPRFLNADLDNLLDMGFLSLSHNGNGKRIFHITRPGAALALKILASH